MKTSPVNIEERKNADIRTGDTVRVHTKIVEKGKTRTQPFEGLVIARKHGKEPGATFTVRRTTGGYGVEKIFPLYSPNIDKIDILRRSKVRQSNVYHVRRKVARQIRREMRRMTLMNETLADESAPSADEQAEAATESQEEEAAQTQDAQAQQEQEGAEEQQEEVQEQTENSDTQETAEVQEEEQKSE